MGHGWKVLALLSLALQFFGASTVYADDPASQVVGLVNAARAQHGVAPLAVSSQLSVSARAYAQAMASGGFFSHVGPNGSTLTSRDQAAGYTGWDYLEENLAAGQTSSAQAVAAWLASPEHQANILSSRVHETGVGFVLAPGSRYTYYWVQEFGDRPSAIPAQAVSASQSPAQPASPAQSLAPAAPAAQSPSVANPPASWDASTGYSVAGSWLSFFRSNGDVDTFGLPLSSPAADPAGGGLTVQYFQRAILESHPDNPVDSRIQRRLLGDLLYPGADPPVSADSAPPGPATYFPVSADSPTGLGHFVANVASTGEPTYFKDFFDAHGGVTAFGFPKEEATFRNGLWTQRFQAAVFEYHPEFDQDGVVSGTTIPLRTYRVQTELLGQEYVQSLGLTLH